MATSLQMLIVDSEPKLTSLLDKLSLIQPPTTHIHPPSLYFDIEGENLGRHGKISILSLFIDPGNTAFLIDIHTLQGTAFTTANDKGMTLKTVLESSTVPKGFFDIRNDSDALFSLFGIKVAAIHDIQLMELARRKGSRRCLFGVAKCIEMDLSGGPDPAAAARALGAKHDGEKLWSSLLGGTHAAFNTRPMPSAIIDYCGADVAVLPSIWKTYVRDLEAPGKMFWRHQVWLKTLERIKESQKASYSPQGREKSLGSWEWQPEELEELSGAWDDELLENHSLGDTFKELSFGELTIT